MMLSKVVLCGVVLFCLLWTEEVEAGTSFLSPADMQKAAMRGHAAEQGKKMPRDLPYDNPGRRAAGDTWENFVDDGSEEIGVTIPLDINLQMTRQQFQTHRAAIENLLLGLFSVGSATDIQEEKA
ncbi:appetite-regulating hormone isoform X2 [Eleutherodactylus coqui]|uniref:appetite-regulating hormone isoform X2 n=1 Tax=Eleutherodactylus coqui TaxID=57060 RepID=UPI003462FACD